MKITNKSLHQQPHLRSTAEQLQVGMHFRLLPHGKESRRQWYTVISRTPDEVKARPISGFFKTMTISNGVRVYRLLSEDVNLTNSDQSNSRIESI